MVFGSQQTATLLTVFEYKKCDQSPKHFKQEKFLSLNLSLKVEYLENGMY